MKKLLASLLVFTMLGMMNANLAMGATFKDVPASHSNYKDIEYLSSKGVISGYSNGTFKPNAPVTNRQAAAMLVKMVGLKQSVSNVSPYRDVGPKDPAYREIYIAAHSGLFPIGGSFEPNAPLTREALARAVSVAFELEGDSPIVFKDVAKSHKSYSYINLLATNNITTGYPDGSFKPNGTVSRAHFSAFLTRASKPNSTSGKLENMVLSKKDGEKKFKIAGEVYTLESYYYASKDDTASFGKDKHTYQLKGEKGDIYIVEYPYKNQSEKNVLLLDLNKEWGSHEKVVFKGSGYEEYMSNCRFTTSNCGSSISRVDGDSIDYWSIHYKNAEQMKGITNFLSDIKGTIQEKGKNKAYMNAIGLSNVDYSFFSYSEEDDNYTYRADFNYSPTDVHEEDFIIKIFEGKMMKSEMEKLLSRANRADFLTVEMVDADTALITTNDADTNDNYSIVNELHVHSTYINVNTGEFVNVDARKWVSHLSYYDSESYRIKHNAMTMEMFPMTKKAATDIWRNSR
ncbi:S-layer homology domain-containing protein [Sporosarcina oncorhynchi]|uniref:S-layer homology domain-containing protein n=1 Tax=Sporosarcina oncorhynchi TaxID=3056444 RepID=A0ABZ0L6I4_9BACL|nr:S-layer homology domain-containing protein [Sporosarcina sp. T2O-4]WOV88176.1 S-layer homology domain-containing protein [Sporosarcina sp. T2O-4]